MNREEILILKVKEKWVAREIITMVHQLEHREKYKKIMKELMRTVSHTITVDVGFISESVLVRIHINRRIVSNYEWIGISEEYINFNGLYITSTHFLNPAEYYIRRTDIRDIAPFPNISYQYLLNPNLGITDIYRPMYDDEIQNFFGTLVFPNFRRSNSI